MKDYKKELKGQLNKARKISLTGLGFAVVAQRKLEKAAKAFLEKGKLKAKTGTRKIVSEALKEQKIAQKKLKAETNKALTIMVKESQKHLSKLEKKIPTKKRAAKKKRR